MIEPWIKYPHVWKTKSSFMSWMRGNIRRSLWSRSPIKLEFIKQYRKRIMKGKREVWGACCNICKKDFPLADIQVDHIVGNHSLKDISDIQSFIEGIVIVDDQDLQLLCKACHKIKTKEERAEKRIRDKKGGLL